MYLKAVISTSSIYQPCWEFYPLPPKSGSYNTCGIIGPIAFWKASRYALTPMRRCKEYHNCACVQSWALGLKNHVVPWMPHRPYVCAFVLDHSHTDRFVAGLQNRIMVMSCHSTFKFL